LIPLLTAHTELVSASSTLLQLADWCDENFSHDANCKDETKVNKDAANCKDEAKVNKDAANIRKSEAKIKKKAQVIKMSPRL
jgi:hypothetical protein